MYYSVTYGIGKSTFCYAFYRNSALSVQNSDLREEFYGVSVNGSLFQPESWTL